MYRIRKETKSIEKCWGNFEKKKRRLPHLCVMDLLCTAVLNSDEYKHYFEIQQKAYYEMGTSVVPIGNKATERGATVTTEVG